MSIAHSPGPWVAEPNRRLRSQVMSESIGVRGPGGLYLAAAFDFNRTDRDAEVEANARLIAAAPDMLAVMESIYVDLVDYSKQLSGSYSTGSIALSSCADQVAAVIAKAKGGAS